MPENMLLYATSCKVISRVRILFVDSTSFNINDASIYGISFDAVPPSKGIITTSIRATAYRDPILLSDPYSQQASDFFRRRPGHVVFFPCPKVGGWRVSIII